MSTVYPDLMIGLTIAALVVGGIGLILAILLGLLFMEPYGRWMRQQGKVFVHWLEERMYSWL